MEKCAVGDVPHYRFPSNYELVTCVGEGGFGEVLKCIKKDTNETVAVKVQKFNVTFNKEVTLMNFFKSKNLDKCNIVRFIETFTLKDNRTALVFEMLDMTLRKYFSNRGTHLDLCEVRSVVQQIATALDALKNVGVIHSDIKLDNIMLVLGEQTPFTLKLIDFGLAFPSCTAKPGMSIQPFKYRAPEIMLGLPFSEAIDMWSLGVVMSILMLGYELFPGQNEHESLQYMIDLLGLPPDNLLSSGKYSKNYFKNCSGHWRLMTSEEYWKRYAFCIDYRIYEFRSLDDVETLPFENLCTVAANERKECIDLLKAIFQMEASRRITPQQVLDHPFIKRGTLQLSATKNETSGTTSTSQQHNFHLKKTAADLPWEEGRSLYTSTWISGGSLDALESDMSTRKERDEVCVGQPVSSPRDCLEDVNDNNSENKHELHRPDRVRAPVPIFSVHCDRKRRGVKRNLSRFLSGNHTMQLEHRRFNSPKPGFLNLRLQSFGNG